MTDTMFPRTRSTACTWLASRFCVFAVLASIHTTSCSSSGNSATDPRNTTVPASISGMGNEAFIAAFELWRNAPAGGEGGAHGHISDWQVSGVTNMSRTDLHLGLVAPRSQYNADLSKWDVSRVETMGTLFSLARAFNGDINVWDVSGVRDMDSMFYGAVGFDSDLSQWDVSHVNDLRFMFQGAVAFSGDISAWDVSSVETMTGMFEGAGSFCSACDLSRWDTSKVKSIARMFFKAQVFNSNIAPWNVSGVLDMSDTFRAALLFDCDISKWNVKNVATMSSMFEQTPRLSPCHKAAISVSWGRVQQSRAFTHAGVGLEQHVQDLDCGSGGANTSTQVAGPKCPRRWEAYDPDRGCEPALRLGVRDCFDAGLNATTFADLWANQSGTFLEVARAGWNAAQYNAHRLSLGRIINNHTHEPLFVDDASASTGAGAGADAGGGGGTICTHLPGYAQVLKDGLLDPAIAYMKQSGYADASHTVNGLLMDGISARTTIDKAEGSGVRVLSLSLWQGHRCSTPVVMGALGLTFEFQFVAQITFQDIIASSYNDGNGDAGVALCLPLQVKIKSEDAVVAQAFSDMYTAILFLNNIRPQGPSGMSSWHTAIPCTATIVLPSMH